jgi:hypothetical protein
MPSRRIDWGVLDDLDRDEGDDRIVAQALNATVDDPSKLVLLSHDMRPRDAAKTHGLSATKLPESWLREPEPSPDQRRINELEAKVRLLSTDQPQLSVLLEVVTPEPWQYRQVAEATSEQTTAMLEARLASAPRQRRGGPFDLDIGLYDYSHGRRIEAWEAVIRENIPLIHQGLTKLFAQHRILVTVNNEGSVSAEGLSLEIRSGNTVLHSIPYWVLLAGPSAPQPRFLHHPPIGFDPRDLVHPRREPFSFYWDECGPGDHLILSCASFRQGKSHGVEVSVELAAGSLPKAHIEAVVTASNMKGDARSRLLVEVQPMATRFDAVYDAEGQILRVRPPVDLPDEYDADDITWYLNGGSEYDRS